MANILVTGGAGYIGSVLVPELLERGHNVTVLDSFLYRQDSLLNCCINKKLTVIRGDCRDKEQMKAALYNKDFILPLAAIVGFPACLDDKTAAQSINTDAVELLLSLRNPSQKVIFPCTNSGYGIGQGENYCTEESPITPVSLYGKTKMAAEKAVLEAGNSTAFRFATLFGASSRMRIDLLVNDFVYRAFHDRAVVLYESNNVRNFLHVRDAANAFMFAMENFDRMNGETFNCGLSDTNITKRELCDRIKKFIPDFTYPEANVGSDPDKRNYYVSNAKIEALGFKPEYSLDDGIRELICAYTILKNTVYGNV